MNTLISWRSRRGGRAEGRNHSSNCDSTPFVPVVLHLKLICCDSKGCLTLKHSFKVVEKTLVLNMRRNAHACQGTR